MTRFVPYLLLSIFVFMTSCSALQVLGTNSNNPEAIAAQQEIERKTEELQHIEKVIEEKKGRAESMPNDQVILQELELAEAHKKLKELEIQNQKNRQTLAGAQEASGLLGSFGPWGDLVGLGVLALGGAYAKKREGSIRKQAKQVQDRIAVITGQEQQAQTDKRKAEARAEEEARLRIEERKATVAALAANAQRDEAEAPSGQVWFRSVGELVTAIPHIREELESAAGKSLATA